MKARESEQGSGHPPTVGSSRGYQWKSLFLPDTTELRMSVSHQTFHARVVGDHIMFEGHHVSPRGLTLAIAGEGRNAWRDLWIRFPGERHFKGANRCRIEVLNSAAPPQLSPAESMHMAAAAMGQALQAALALVQHSCARHATVHERRVERHRRASDVLGDDCAFD